MYRIKKSKQFLQKYWSKYIKSYSCTEDSCDGWEHQSEPTNGVSTGTTNFFLPSYRQTGDGTKPLWCIQPSCKASRILLCQLDVLQEMKNRVSCGPQKRTSWCLQETISSLQHVKAKTGQHLTRYVTPYHRSTLVLKILHCSCHAYRDFIWIPLYMRTR